MVGVEPLRSEVPSAKVLSLLWVVNLTFQYKVNKIHPKVFVVHRGVHVRSGVKKKKIIK